jgi:hypothetical protein
MLQFVRRSRRSNLLPAEDMLSVGLVGLRRAAARYDPARKTRFSTVATVWIMQVCVWCIYSWGCHKRWQAWHLALMRTTTCCRSCTYSMMNTHLQVAAKAVFTWYSSAAAGDVGACSALFF